MRFPVDNWYTDWNITAGYQFGQKINDNYYHEAYDINDNHGGDSDLDKPLYAIADGVITSVHTHTTSAFGNHIHLKIEGDYGTRWAHYAHLNKVFVGENQIVKEGQFIGTVGKTGNSKYAHLHFALKRLPTGIDAIAKTIEQLISGWEDPIEFIENQMKKEQEGGKEEVITLQTKIPQIENKEVQAIKSELSDLRRDNKGLKDEVESLKNQSNSSNAAVEILKGIRDALARVINFKQYD